MQEKLTLELKLSFDVFDEKLERLVGQDSIAGQFEELKEVLARVIEEERTSLTREKKRISELERQAEIKKALKRLEKKKLANWPDLKHCAFCPSQEQILSYSMEQVLELHIRKIECWVAGTICSLTFVFADGSRSPPEQSYTHEPSKIFEIPEDQTIGSVHFGTNSVPWLAALHLYDRHDGMICEVQGTNKVKDKQVIKLERHQHIVSAAIELESKYNTNVYNASGYVFRANS